MFWGWDSSGVLPCHACAKLFSPQNWFNAKKVNKWDLQRALCPPLQRGLCPPLQRALCPPQLAAWWTSDAKAWDGGKDGCWRRPCWGWFLKTSQSLHKHKWPINRTAVDMGFVSIMESPGLALSFIELHFHWQGCGFCQVRGYCGYGRDHCILPQPCCLPALPTGLLWELWDSLLASDKWANSSPFLLCYWSRVNGTKHSFLWDSLQLKSVFWHQPRTAQLTWEKNHTHKSHNVWSLQFRVGLDSQLHLAHMAHRLQVVW